VTETDHFAAHGWQHVFERVSTQAAKRGAHLAACVVLLPYAQLMPEAQRQWQRLYPNSFAPRFETTRNWAHALGGRLPAKGEFSGDMALDSLSARQLLGSAGLAEHADPLTTPLLEMAGQLAQVVAAIAPTQRVAWGEQARGLLPPIHEASGGGVLRFEAATARIALEWVLASQHASDVLFDPGVRTTVELLVVVKGMQPDPLAHALLAHWGAAGFLVAWPAAAAIGQTTDHIALHPCEDAEDEAQRAAACVLAHVAAGRTPVALTAGDRALTRRIAALLEAVGMPVQDENGWTLSTTRAAARLMGVLRACTWNASADAVLDWLKHSPAAMFHEQGAALHALEQWLRRFGPRHWRAAVAALAGQSNQRPLEAALAAQVEVWRAPWQAAPATRSLAQWLQALRTLLHDCGQWNALAQDTAGQRVLTVLRLTEGQDSAVPASAPLLSLAAFTRWVQQVLEAARFRPALRAHTPVVILPLAHLLARPFVALVLPGCDEKRLPAAPEPPGAWTPTQRQGLGLSTREDLAAAQQAAWQHALRTPHSDILWRTSDGGGEALLPSPLVLTLQLDGLGQAGQEVRSRRTVPPAPVIRPQPSGALLPLQQLSSTAYGDLRHCPYRFFALRQLRLQEADEIGTEPDKRDFGIWLHAVLQTFHLALHAAPDGDREALMDAAAARITHEQRWQEGDFLPWSSSWPALRDGYLHWWARHEAQGAVFHAAEVQASLPLDDALELVGKIDRIDDQEGTSWVMDYKTENEKTTQGRIAAGNEDHQLAFYAALLPEATQLRAAYINVGERGTTRLYEQPDVLALRDELLAGMRSDMARIAQGAPLPALGEGASCERCHARGVCRKDFWQAA